MNHKEIPSPEATRPANRLPPAAGLYQQPLRNNGGDSDAHYPRFTELLLALVGGVQHFFSNRDVAF